MKPRVFAFLLLGVAIALPFTIRADQERNPTDRDDRDCRDSDHHEHNVKTPVRLIGVIPVPGNPITSADIAWVDPGTERYYFADRSNFGVDIIDAESNLFVGRVGGMVGPTGPGAPNGPGPNGVLVTPNGKLWAGDGNSQVQVADVNPDSPNYNIIGTISTALPVCDSASAHYCGRADELGYDPKHHVILIANNAPLSVAAPHGPIDPYATFISAVPPYPVLGHIAFAGAGGLEQPLWDAGIGRFLLTVPGKIVGGVVVTQPSVVVINPTTMMVEHAKYFDCQALAGVTNASANGIALGAFQHVLVSACGQPMLFSALKLLKPGVLTPIVIKQVGGGDEVWYNPGDGRFFVTGTSATVTPPVQQLGVIDAEHSMWLQNVSDPTGTFASGKNASAFPEQNHIFTIVQIPVASAIDPTKDISVCTQFGLRGRGCIAVYAHGTRGDDEDEK